MISSNESPTSKRPAPSAGGSEEDDEVRVNDLEADNAVEEETIESVDPQNPPA